MKYYPPFHISRITQTDKETSVMVQFYEVDRVVFTDNLAVKDRGDGQELHTINAASGGKMIRVETFTLSPVSAEEARSQVYQKLEQKGHERVER